MREPALLGAHLTSLREQAGLKQNELAKKLAWSAAVLSRVESGDRSLAPEELEIVLAGIGTPEASRVRDLLARQWSIFPEPQLDEPEADLLWDAEQTAQKIRALAERPDVKKVFERRLTRYAEELATATKRVMQKRYRAVFVGTIAVGKSTAICRAEGLELPTDKGMPKAVLETGAGGITICEVHLRQGPEYGLIIEPCSEEEIRHHVADFANFLLASAQLGIDTEGEPTTVGVSREVERALRNMSGLRRRRAERKADGSVVPAIDFGRELAATVPDNKALSVEILERMQLHKRSRRDMWYSENAGKPALEWLQELFEKVNNGRHPEFTLPRRVELVVPGPILGDQALSVTLIDTQGIDDIAARADLEQHFDDPHTVVMLCTVFNEAPATPIRQLLTRAKEGGVRTLQTHVSLLALPRPGEAIAMKDNGYPAQNAREGYELKAEEVHLKLHPIGLENLPVEFFNAAEDAPEVLREFVLSRIYAAREAHRQALVEIIGGAKALLANYEGEQTREIVQVAARRILTWLENEAELLKAKKVRVHDSLLSATGSAHWRTVCASVSRRGEWPKLDYAHQLSHGARRVATQLAAPKLNDFRAIANNLLQDEDLAQAHDLVSQAVRVLEEGFDDLVRTALLVGESIYADELSGDDDFWRGCNRESGGGYRDRINERNRNWFEEEHDGEADSRVTDAVRNRWKKTTNSVRHLVTQE